MKINFGLDWDGTVDRAPDEFLAFVKSLMAAGHGVYIVTMRYPSELKEIEAWREHVTGIVCTCRKSKHNVCSELGIHIAVWIEDTPKAVYMDGKDIWGFVTPEGYVHSKPILENTIIRSNIVIGTGYIPILQRKGYLQSHVVNEHLTARVLQLGLGDDADVAITVDVNTTVIDAIKLYTGKGAMVPIVSGDGLELIETKTVSSISILQDIHQVA